MTVPAPADDDLARHYLRRYLKEAPLAVALFRASEAVAFSSVEMQRPILDIGCGFGEFGRIFFEGEAPPDAGLDLDLGELRRERQAPTYANVTCANARRLPFSDCSFSTVMSVSTLEHIPDVEDVFGEIARVLRPGGLAVFSVPIDVLSENLLGYRALRLLNQGVAARYALLVHRALTHVNVWPAVRWIALASSSGLVVEQARPILSPGATKLFEALLPAALASRAWRRVTGTRPPHPEALMRMAERRMRPYVIHESPKASNLFVVARKPR
jgi:SAM-dependent methyltransferase